MSEWQPISTAPKDGTTVLLFRRVEPWNVVGYGTWFDDYGAQGWLARGFSDPPGNLGLVHPTHWAPLPKPPQPASEPEAT